MTTQRNAVASRPQMTAGGLFSGIGGLELGFRNAGFADKFFCENDPDARAVLSEHFPATRSFHDIRLLKNLPAVDTLLAGFPCQDLSTLGSRTGLNGTKSTLVNSVFDLVASAKHRPTWIVLENVPFMLQLHKGSAVSHIVARLEALGYRWAYRVVDSRAFGLPQRRRRVFLVATSSDVDPANVLFADNAESQEVEMARTLACGFYWTEGNQGVGWAIDTIPTLKGGSALSIPSPPAIWVQSTDKIVLPSIRDAERLQGFPVDWTRPAEMDDPRRQRRRWRLVGNAVSVPVAEWLANRIRRPGQADHVKMTLLPRGHRWPTASCVRDGKRYAVDVSEWPLKIKRPHLMEFLRYETSPISRRAAAGFLSRAQRSSLYFHPGFLEAVEAAATFEPGNHGDSGN